jgi:hypothetical protein
MCGFLFAVALTLASYFRFPFVVCSELSITASDVSVASSTGPALTTAIASTVAAAVVSELVVCAELESDVIECCLSILIDMYRLISSFFLSHITFYSHSIHVFEFVRAIRRLSMADVFTG